MTAKTSQTKCRDTTYLFSKLTKLGFEPYQRHKILNKHIYSFSKKVSSIWRFAIENRMKSKTDRTKKNGANENLSHILVKLLKQNLYYDMFFFLVTFMGLYLSLIRIHDAIEQSHYIDSGVHIRNDSVKYIGVINARHDKTLKNLTTKKKAKLPEGIKYILVWTKAYRSPVDTLVAGRTIFLKKNCSVNKCYVTRNRKLFRKNMTKFDAIVFIGQGFSASDVPDVRSPHQKYIYFNMESSKNFPACNPQYDGFFNWTATYRLDSDIPYPYILIRDMNGKIVGPKHKMRWEQNMTAVGDELSDRIVNKTKAAAWFVSNCRSVRRLQFVKQLNKALSPYGLTVDMYGKCGTMKCPREQSLICNQKLERDYFFYMSLENSFAEDYVTEKLLRALNHNVVPIVFGGADYSRFLPPGSYINARKQSAVQLAAMMNKLIKSPKLYLQYFRWKQYYTYHSPVTTENVCALCKALHDQRKVQETTIYNEFRKWWNPNFRRGCGKIIQYRYKNMTLRLKHTPQKSLKPD